MYIFLMLFDQHLLTLITFIYCVHNKDGKIAWGLWLQIKGYRNFLGKWNKFLFAMSYLSTLWYKPPPPPPPRWIEVVALLGLGVASMVKTQQKFQASDKLNGQNAIG